MTPTRPDVVVVGGGIIGLSAAWYLRKAGIGVTLLSRDPVVGGTSAGNAGMIVPSHVVPLSAPGAISEGLRYLLSRTSPFYIKPRLDPELARWLWRFMRSCTEAHTAYAAPFLRDQSLASVRLFSELQVEIGDFDWSQTGLLMLYRSEKYRKDNLQSAELAESLGLRVRRLDGPETRELEPSLRAEVLGSVLYEDDGRVNPSLLLARLRDALQAGGVNLREGAEVRSMGKGKGGRIRIRLAGGEGIDAERVVLAAGAWTGRLARSLGASLPIQPAKGYSFTVPAPEEGPSLPMILSEEKVTLTPYPGHLRFAGTLALAGFDLSVDPLRARPIREEVHRYLPGLSPEEGESLPVWSGFRPASPDGLPLVGPLETAPGVLVAAGHGMIGVTLGPVTGRLVADLVTGSDPVVDPAPLDPNRF